MSWVRTRSKCLDHLGVNFLAYVYRPEINLFKSHHVTESMVVTLQPGQTCHISQNRHRGGCLGMSGKVEMV